MHHGNEFAGFEDDLEVSGAAGFLHGGDFVENADVIAGEERAAVDDHVDLVGAIGDGTAGFLKARAKRILSTRKAGRHTGDADGGVLTEKLSRPSDHIRINTDCGARRHFGFGFHGLSRLATERGDLVGGVFAFEVGEVHHSHRHFQAGQLGGGLDAAFGEGGRALFDHHLVNGSEACRVLRVAWRREGGRGHGAKAR